MIYNKDKEEIILQKELNDLDKLVLKFLNILEKEVEYVIISGYVSILLGRSRATEDIDLFIRKISKEVFLKLYKDLDKSDFWCLNTNNPEEAFDYLEKGLAIRFAIKETVMPNFEVKFPKRKIDEETFKEFINVKTKEGIIKISSLERQIAFKKYFLGTEKDEEDALFVEELFKESLDYEKINKFREIIDNINKNER